MPKKDLAGELSVPSCLFSLESSAEVFLVLASKILAERILGVLNSHEAFLLCPLNAMRIPFMKDRNIEDFEFSQGYLFFWDKVERSNYFLNTIADSYCREPKEDVGGRLVSFLLGNPICDGGQWDMVVNLIEKHGEFISEQQFIWAFLFKKNRFEDSTSTPCFYYFLHP